MERSIERILTTHTGSLPRPDDLLALVRDKNEGRPRDAAAIDDRVRAAVADVVQRQLATGLDIINDGEQSKPDYSTYIRNRFTGFEGEPLALPMNADLKDFPDFAARSQSARLASGPSCSGPIAWKDWPAVEKDIDNLKKAVAGSGAQEVFMTSVSPGQAARFLPNRYYGSDEAYLAALAEALGREYTAIVNAGFLLQLDCPDLASGRNNQFQHLTLAEFQKVAEMHVELLNHAVADIPPDRMRLHVCWGNYEGPHHRDVPLRDIIAVLLKARPAGLSFEGANPRHAHEWKLFEEAKPPGGKVIIPGAIDSTTNFIEHPELVAQRIVQHARLVGRENVIAGADCGFATFAHRPVVDPDIAWAKLRSLVEGARLASRELWK